MALAIRDIIYINGARTLMLVLLAFFIAFVIPAHAEDPSGEILIISVYDANITLAELEHADRSGMDGHITLFELPLWTQVDYILESIGTILGSLIFFPAVLYKIKGSLTNENRKSITSYIMKNPGCIMSHIIHKERISKGTVRYHISKLKSEGKIVLKRIGKSLRIFISSQALSEKEKTVAAYTCYEKERKILYTILEHEGSTNQYISNKLHMSKSVMHKYLNKYTKCGIINFKLEGRNKKYFLDIEVKNILAKYKNSSKA